MARSELTNTELLTLIVYDLGGDQNPIDTEDIAVRAHSLAPLRFGLRKYPEHVDIERVRKRLSDGKKQSEHGTLLRGSFRHGWHLPPEGLDWAQTRVTHLSDADRTSTDRESSRRRQIESTRIVGTDAWANVQAGESVSRREAEAVFRLTPYVASDRRLLIVDAARNLFRDEPLLGNFIEQMAELTKE